MPNVKISELPAATTPLAGTELVPIVQSGTTDKVTVADLTAGRAVSASALTASSGNLTFSGTAQRITGDFSNATVADRLMVQTTTTNGNTLVGVMPNGTGNASHISFYSSTDTVNGSFTRMGATSATSESYIQAGRSGTGTYYPLTFYAGGSRRVDIDTSGNLDIKAGNLLFSGTAQRITGDMSNATVANRLAFQTSTVNGNSGLFILPNGTGTTSSLQIYPNSDPTNSAYLQVRAATTLVGLNSAVNGTGTFLPMTFETGGSERMRIDTSGNVGIGTTIPGQRLDLGGGNLTLSSTTGTQQIFLYRFSATNYSSIGTDSSAGGVTFTTGTSAPTERMRIDSSGNVGIGTTSPGAKLDVYAASGTVAQYVRVGGSTGTDIAVSYASAGSTLIQNLAYGNGYTYSTSNASVSHVTGTSSNAPVLLNSNNVERMRVAENGNIVQGTAAVATNATAGFLWITSCAGAPTGAPSAPYTNAAALVCDTTNNRLYVRVGSTWRYATLT